MSLYPLHLDLNTVSMSLWRPASLTFAFLSLDWCPFAGARPE